MDRLADKAILWLFILNVDTTNKFFQDPMLKNIAHPINGTIDCTHCSLLHPYKQCSSYIYILFGISRINASLSEHNDGNTARDGGVDCVHELL